MPDPTSPLSVATLLLHAKQLEIDAARHLAGRAELVDVLGQLIHELQRERGASSAFLASRGQRMDVQKNLWGINLYPERLVPEWIEFDSMINVRPSGGNRSRYVESAEIRDTVTTIVNRLVER